MNEIKSRASDKRYELDKLLAIRALVNYRLMMMSRNKLILDAFNNNVSPSEIRRLIGVSRATVNRIVDAAAKAGELK
jgi:DNA-binding MarR family transcriptional regulator